MVMINLNNVVTFVIGAILLIILTLIVIRSILMNRETNLTLDVPTNDTEFDDLQNTPHCPFCNSYEIVLIDDNSGVPWLKGKIAELDHYECQRCHERFSDETWQETKTYEGRSMTDD